MSAGRVDEWSAAADHRRDLHFTLSRARARHPDLFTLERIDTLLRERGVSRAALRMDLSRSSRGEARAEVRSGRIGGSVVTKRLRPPSGTNDGHAAPGARR